MQQNPASLILKKARTIALWSLVGILVPIVGIILAGISKSLLKILVPKSDRDDKKISSVRTIADAGIGLSIISVIIAVGFGVWAANLSEDTPGEHDQETTQTQSVPTQNYYNQTMLGECLDGVNKWYNENVVNVETIYQEQNLLTTKQQLMDECALRYPAD